MDIKYGKKTKTLTRNEKNGSFKNGMKEIDETRFTELVEMLAAPTIYGIVEDRSGFDSEDRKPIVSIKYTKSRGRGSVDVKIYDNGDGDYSISVNGEEDFYLDSEEVEVLFEDLDENIF